MIDTRIRLSVLHDDDGTFVDFTEQAADYGRDTFSVTLNAADDYLYLGYYKPFGAAYCEMLTANTTPNTFTVEYWDGSAWVDVTDGRDLSKGFTRSGWLTWARADDWAATSVNSTSKFWVRLKTSDTHTASAVSGISLVFADDYDLETEFPAVRESGFLFSGEVSHIKTHTAVRNQVIQDLRNQGMIKQDADGTWLNLTPWDLHDIEEVRQAATYLALAKIMFNYSDNTADQWSAKSKYYDTKYKDTLKHLAVSYDSDDDGVADSTEAVPFKTVRMYR